MKHSFTVFLSAVFGITGYVFFKAFDFMYGIIIVFHNDMFRIEAPAVGIIIGALIGLIVALISDIRAKENELKQRAEQSELCSPAANEINCTQEKII